VLFCGKVSPKTDGDTPDFSGEVKIPLRRTDPTDRLSEDPASSFTCLACGYERSVRKRLEPLHESVEQRGRISQGKTCPGSAE
jgi:hypothetical protein